jgi:hypothetical protein
MKNFEFTVSIAANTKAEAAAKLNLMLQWAAFPKDRDVVALGTSAVNYLVFNYLGKVLSNNIHKTTPSQKQPSSRIAKSNGTVQQKTKTQYQPQSKESPIELVYLMPKPNYKL